MIGSPVGMLALKETTSLELIKPGKHLLFQDQGNLPGESQSWRLFLWWKVKKWKYESLLPTVLTIHSDIIDFIILSITLKACDLCFKNSYYILRCGNKTIEFSEGQIRCFLFLLSCTLNFLDLKNKDNVYLKCEQKYFIHTDIYCVDFVYFIRINNNT